MKPRIKETLDATDNSRIYKRVRKYYLNKKGEVSCVYCPYHEFENLTHRYQKSWKRKTKKRKQYEASK